MTEQGDTMSNIIDFIRGIASRLSDRPAVYRPGGSGCAESIDPSPAIESLAMPRQWNTGADLVDAYESGCWERGAGGTTGETP
jgi:hypothetical protein